jgi:glycosyltransferase involved in cell wall biosynthesis
LKKVLIITYYFPPISGIGVLRPLGLAKYLSFNGWDPIILTPILPGDPDPQFKVIQTPYLDVIELWKRRVGLDPKKSLNAQFHIVRKKNKPSIIERFFSIPNEIITYPDDRIGWYDNAVLAGEKILQTEPVDAILSSSSPVTCHLIAKTLAEKYHIPWVADFRDLWSQNHYFSYSHLRKYFEKKLEIKTLKYASAITTVSQPLAEKLARLHENKKIFSINNGFDPDLINIDNKVDQFFKIVYTGILYEGKRDPANLFAIIYNLLNKEFINRDDIKIDFFGYPKKGYPEDWLQDEIAKYHLQDFVTLHGEVSHDIAVAEQRNAQILLLLTWNDPEEKGVYTGKLFEYLAAHRPILSTGYIEGGVVKDLLIKTQTGIHAGNEKELNSAILQAYHEYKEFGAVQYHGINTEIMKFSQTEMARKFAEVLNEITK